MIDQLKEVLEIIDEHLAYRTLPPPLVVRGDLFAEVIRPMVAELESLRARLEALEAVGAKAPPDYSRA